MKTIVLVLGISLGGASLCVAQTLETAQVLERLQDRLNSRALSSVIGAVDYEFVYAAATEQGQVVLLENPPVLQVVLPDSAEIKQRTAAVQDSLAALASYFTDRGLGAAAQDSLDLRWPGGAREGLKDVEQYLRDAVQTRATRDSLVVLGLQEWEEPVAPVAGGAPGSTTELASTPEGEQNDLPANPPIAGLGRAPLTAAQLPADLKQADVAMLKNRLRSPHGAAGHPLYLGVRPATEDPRFPGERLTLAESELSVEDRRQTNWDLREVFDQWPAGTVLALETTTPETKNGEVVEVPMRWSFRRPGPPPFDKPEILASGVMNLSMRKVGEEWKISHVEWLIAALHAEVVKE